MNNSTVLMSCTLLVLANTATAKDSFNSPAFQKQITIMTNIMKSSTPVQEGRKSSKISYIDATYLQGQGVVFTISSNTHSRHTGSYHFNFSTPIAPPVPTVALSSFSSSEVREFEREIEVEMSEAFAEVERAMGDIDNSHDEYREQYRDVVEEQRDITYDIRDIDRDIRNLSFQSKRADKNAKVEFSKQLKKLEGRKSALVKKQEVVKKQVVQFKQSQKKEQLAQEKQRNAFYQRLNYSLAETLCLYGNGLRSLPKSEHVNLIIKAGGKKVNKRYNDQIFVFNKKDINSCSNDEITIEQLLIKGKGYQF